MRSSGSIKKVRTNYYSTKKSWLALSTVAGNN